MMLACSAWLSRLTGGAARLRFHSRAASCSQRSRSRVSASTALGVPCHTPSSRRRWLKCSFSATLPALPAALLAATAATCVRHTCERTESTIISNSWSCNHAASIPSAAHRAWSLCMAARAVAARDGAAAPAWHLLAWNTMPRYLKLSPLPGAGVQNGALLSLPLAAPLCVVPSGSPSTGSLQSGWWRGARAATRGGSGGALGPEIERRVASMCWSRTWRRRAGWRRRRRGGAAAGGGRPAGGGGGSGAAGPAATGVQEQQQGERRHTGGRARR